MPSKNLTPSQKVAKNKRRAFSRTKNTLIKKANNLARVHGAEVALVVRKNKRCYTYRSSDGEDWNPKIDVNVSTKNCFILV